MIRCDVAREDASIVISVALDMSAIVLAGIGTLFIQRRIYMRRRIAHLHDDARAARGLPLRRSRRVGGPTDKTSDSA